MPSILWVYNVQTYLLRKQYVPDIMMPSIVQFVAMMSDTFLDRIRIILIRRVCNDGVIAYFHSKYRVFGVRKTTQATVSRSLAKSRMHDLPVTKHQTCNWPLYYPLRQTCILLKGCFIDLVRRNFTRNYSLYRLKCVPNQYSCDVCVN